MAESASRQSIPRSKSPWNWHPQFPLAMPPVFIWPPQPVAALKFILGRGFAMSQMMIYVLLGIATWFYLAPGMEGWKTFSPDWIFHVWAINMGLSIVVAGGLHLYFHTWKCQGKVQKYEHRDLARKNRTFLFNNQVWDNIFWTCASGITVWTGFQVLLMWAYANQIIMWNTWSDNPYWFVGLFLILTAWESMHFYFIHRLIHWPPLYKIAHALHHKNVTIGPWSGLAMHPIEHLFYFSTVLIHLVIPSHPIHMFFHIYLTALSAYTGHVGFETIVIKGKSTLGVANMFHQLHHRYFECNYGTPYMPWDKWLGTMHDGTEEATRRINQRRVGMGS